MITFQVEKMDPGTHIFCMWKGVCEYHMTWVDAMQPPMSLMINVMGMPHEIYYKTGVK